QICLGPQGHLAADEHEITAAEPMTVGQMHGPVPVTVWPDMRPRQARAVGTAHGNHVVLGHYARGPEPGHREARRSGTGPAIVAGADQRRLFPRGFRAAVHIE